jgi:putative Mn2+ efflux pump MntP
MYKDARSKTPENCATELHLTRMMVLALATSIDAFGVGLSIALLPFNIYLTSIIIGVICFIISWLGFAMGNKLSRFGKAEYFGALVLLAIGVKMLIA